MNRLSDNAIDTALLIAFTALVSGLILQFKFGLPEGSVALASQPISLTALHWIMSALTPTELQLWWNTITIEYAATSTSLIYIGTTIFVAALTTLLIKKPRDSSTQLAGWLTCCCAAYVGIISYITI